MSKRQHHSQSDLRGYFAQPGFEGIEDNIEKIKQAEAAKKKSKAIAIAKSKEEKPPVRIELTSDYCFCLNTAKTRLAAMLKAEKVTKSAIICANGKEFSFENQGERVWRFVCPDRSVLGSKSDLVVTAAGEAVAAFRHN